MTCETPIDWVILGRTVILSSLALTGLRDTKGPGLSLEGGLGFFMFPPFCKSGDYRVGRIHPPAQEKRGAFPTFCDQGPSEQLRD